MVKSLLNLHKPNSAITIQPHELSKGDDATLSKQIIGNPDIWLAVMNTGNGTESLLVIFVITLLVVVVPYEIQRSYSLYSTGNIVEIVDSNTSTTTTSKQKIIEGFSL